MGARLELSATPQRARASRAWQQVMAPFFVSRVLSDSLLIALGDSHRHHGLLNGFERWDGRWYTAIALHGYAAVPHVPRHQTPWPFFPLLPMAMRAVASSGMPVAIAGIVVNHLAFFVALVGIQRLAERHFSPATANLAVWLTALGPLAFVFSMLYPSSLFLAASVWAFVFVEERRDLAGGVAAAFAALSRPDGVVVVVVLVLAVGLVASRVVRIATPAALAIGGWVCLNGLRSGDPLRFIDAKAAWHEVDIAAFVSRPTPLAALHLAVASAALGLVFLARRSLPRPWTWYTFAYLVPSLALGMVGLARYATETFPPYLATASLTQRRHAAVLGVVCATFLAVQVFCAWVFIEQGRLI